MVTVCVGDASAIHCKDNAPRQCPPTLCYTCLTVCQRQYVPQYTPPHTP